MTAHPDWLVPGWPAPANVHALCTTRSGGDSHGAYESMNLGDHVGDAPQFVASNRAAFADALGARPVFLRQVHGARVVTLDASTPDGTQADGCVADCLPILLCDADGTAVGAAHAGWRGLAGQDGTGILEAFWEAFRAVARATPAQGASKTIAWLGPCIGPEAFEVGPEVKAAFEAHDRQAAAMFKPHGPGKWLADLQGLARQRLAALGITRIHGNDGSRGWCTVANPSRFFSHRRDGVSGRLAAAVWLR